MKVKDKVIINEGIYKGVKAVITGFEHINITDNIIKVNDNPDNCDRVELYSQNFSKHTNCRVLYFSRFDLKRCV